jgi:NADH-quinone oxidoreductase subunit J
MAETVVFVIFAAVAIAGGGFMVTARNPVYSAMGLLTAMFSIAVLYVVLDAHFIAAVQIIIYAGAVMTLFLFVIMLIGVDRVEDRTEEIPLQRPLTAIVSIGLLAAILLAGRQAWITGTRILGDADLSGTIENVADELFGTWTLAFMATIFLLTIAALGTVALAQFGPAGLRSVASSAEDEPEEAA